MVRIFPGLDLQPKTSFRGRVEHAFLEFQRDPRPRSSFYIANCKNMADQNLHLYQRESVPYAYPGPDPEREIRPRAHNALPIVQKSLRLEFLGIVVVLGISMDRFDGDPHVHPRLDGERNVAGQRGGQLETLDAHSVYENGDRMEPENFVYHSVQVSHLLYNLVRQLAVVPLQRLVDLLLQSLLDLGVLDQHVEKHARLGSDRVEAAEEEAERVIGHVLNGETLLTRFPLVPRIHHQLDQIRVRRPVPFPLLDRLHHEIGEKFRYVPLQYVEPEQVGQPRHVPVHEYLEILLQPYQSGAHSAVHVEHVPGLLYRVHVHPVDATRDHVVGVSGEQRLHLHFPLLLGQFGQVMGESLGALGHLQEHTFDLARGEGGREHVPVLLPLFPVHDEQHLAEHRVHALAKHGAMIGELLEILHRDALDQVQIPYYYHGSEKLEYTHVLDVRMDVVHPLNSVVYVLLSSDQRAQITHERGRRDVKYAVLLEQIETFPHEAVIIGDNRDRDEEQGQG